jgi:hypothetical protein
VAAANGTTAEPWPVLELRTLPRQKPKKSICSEKRLETESRARSCDGVFGPKVFVGDGDYLGCLIALIEGDVNCCGTVITKYGCIGLI